jgi:hypothetical protein
MLQHKLEAMTMTKELMKAAEAATAKVGAALVGALANTFGSTDGTVADVPADKHSGLTSALERLVAGGAIPVAMAARGASGDPIPKPTKAAKPTGEDTFRAIRAEAYGDDDEPAPAPKTLDPVSIFANWNKKRNARG